MHGQKVSDVFSHLKATNEMHVCCTPMSIPRIVHLCPFTADAHGRCSILGFASAEDGKNEGHGHRHQCQEGVLDTCKSIWLGDEKECLDKSMCSGRSNGYYDGTSTDV